MLIAVLIVLNIPIFLGIAWLMFDTKENAADSFLGTVGAILTSLLFGLNVACRFVIRHDWDWDIFRCGVFLIACGLVVYGEYCLIKTLWL